MSVTAVTSESLPQVWEEISALFPPLQVAQDYRTGCRLWALGYGVSACANEWQIDGWVAAEIDAEPEPAIEDDHAWVRTGC